MNGWQRIRAALDGRWPDRRPVMLHNFMMAAREAGLTQRQYRTDPHAIARAFIESVEKYELDGVLVDVDTATLAGAAGVPVEFPEDEPAVARGALLESLDEVDRLEPVDVAAYPGVQVWLEAVRLLKAHFGGEIWIRGNCDQAPFSLAAMLRGMEGWLMDLTEEANRERAHRLLDYTAGITGQFIDLMAATGADMVSNGDSSAGTSLISPAMHRAFAHPWERRIAERAHALGLPWALHVCGNAGRILCDLADTGADAIELDCKTDTRLAHEVLRHRATFIGNIDPSGVLALGTPALVEAKTRELMDAFSDTPRLILNAGCALPAATPPENVRAMVRAALW
ncbi:MAG: uroporphyrinogen decarboxylase family protein [Acidobacteriota bacterium]